MYLICKSAPKPSSSSSFMFRMCHSPPALFKEPVSHSYSFPSGPDVWGNKVISDPRPRALSVIAVRPELDSLYKLMNEQSRGEGLGGGGRPCGGVVCKKCK